jgi:hypothetical protein
VGFLEVVVLPMFRMYTATYPDSCSLLHSMEINLQMWQRLAATPPRVSQA